MVTGTLVMALDFAARNGDTSGTRTRLASDGWYVVKYGPGYSNTFKVTEYDEAGLAWLRQHQLPEEECPKTQTT